MRRSQKILPIGADLIRVVVRLETDDAPPNSPLYRYHQFHLLRTLAEQPDLTNCGLSAFQKLTIHHNGERWIAEAEAVVEHAGAPFGNKNDAASGAT